MLEKENELLLDQRDVTAAEAAEAARSGGGGLSRGGGFPRGEGGRGGDETWLRRLRGGSRTHARTGPRGRLVRREFARGERVDSRCEPPRAKERSVRWTGRRAAEKLITGTCPGSRTTALRTEMEEMKAELGRMREASKDARAGKDAEAATAAAKEASELRAKLRATEAALAAERARAREEEETSKTLLAKLKAAEAALAAERARAGRIPRRRGDSEETRLLREALERVESELARQREETAWRVADAELRARKDAEAELRAPDADRRPEDRFLTPGASPASSEGTTSPKSPTGITAQPGKREQRAEHRGISLPG